MKELDNNLKKLLKNINECCIKIIEKDNLKCKLKKIDFLEKERFYDKYSEELFEK